MPNRPVSHAACGTSPLAYQRSSGDSLERDCRTASDGENGNGIGLPAREEDRADDRQDEYQQERGIVNSAHVVPHEGDHDDADRVQER